MVKEVASVDRRDMKEEMPSLVTERIRRTTEMEELFTHSTYASHCSDPTMESSITVTIFEKCNKREQVNK